jgi:ABC-type transport system substrate-binding protein
VDNKFNILWIVALALLCAISVAATDTGDGVVFGSARSGNVFRIKALSGSFRDQLDPINPASFIFLSEQLYDGLVSLDNEFNIVPALAEYWNKSYDGRIYRFELRQGVNFHHGEEVTAHDVKFSLERILEAETESPYSQVFLGRIEGAEDFHSGRAEDVAGIKVIDRYTLEIVWTKPYAMALYLMSMHFCKVLPQNRVLEKGEGFFQKPSGTGPFVFDHWIRDARLDKVGVRLKRNEQYFEGSPHLDAVEWSPDYNLTHFLNGEIDSIFLILNTRFFWTAHCSRCF